MLGQMTKQDKRDFEINCMHIHWIQYLMLYTYGVHKWILKDNKAQIPVDLSGHDLNWYFNQKSLV